VQFDCIIGNTCVLNDMVSGQFGGAT
jgi:hypothetical protein